MLQRLRSLKWWQKALLVLFVGWLVLQLFPLDMDNPPVRREPNWDSPQTRELAKTSCFDCHSNETEWPWYSHIAPVRFLIWNDVRSGRGEMNFSDWDNRSRSVGEIIEVIQTGRMPPDIYTLMHSNAKLSSDERDALSVGIRETLAQTEGSAENGD